MRISAAAEERGPSACAVARRSRSLASPSACSASCCWSSPSRDLQASRKLARHLRGGSLVRISPCELLPFATSLGRTLCCSALDAPTISPRVTRPVSAPCRGPREILMITCFSPRVSCPRRCCTPPAEISFRAAFAGYAAGTSCASWTVPGEHVRLRQKPGPLGYDFARHGVREHARHRQPAPSRVPAASGGGRPRVAAAGSPPPVAEASHAWRLQGARP